MEKYKWAVRMRKKSDTEAAFKAVLSDCQARSGRKLRVIKTDGDGPFVAKSFNELCV